jgi:ceramide glucosyltransferase
MTLAENAFLAYCLGIVLSHVVLEYLARAALRAAETLPTTAAPEPVSVIKPVYRTDPYTEDCFRSWLTQEYPGEVQFVFSLQDPEDPALALLERLAADPGLPDFEVIVNSIEPGYHGKTSNLLHGVRVARHGMLVLSDADIEAPPGTLSKLVAAVQRGPELAGCPVIHDRPVGYWGRIYALVWNVACIHLCGPSLAFGPVGMAPGGTIALRRESLRDLGGIEALRGFITDDLALNQASQRAGMGRGLGPVVRSPVGDLGWWGWVDKLSRGTAAFREFPGAPFTLLTIPLAYAYLFAIPAFAWSGNLRMVAVGVALLLARAVFGGFMTSRSEGQFRLSFDMVVLEFQILACTFVAPFRRSFTWDGVSYRQGTGGIHTT